MIESEDLLKQAEDIFFELALENLTDVKLNFMQANPEALFLEVHEDFSEDWAELLYEEIDSEEYVELAMYITINERTERLALFLLSVDLENNKECHIQW